jgi:hypothetical protein
LSGLGGDALDFIGCQLLGLSGAVASGQVDVAVTAVEVATRCDFQVKGERDALVFQFAPERELLNLECVGHMASVVSS